MIQLARWVIRSLTVVLVLGACSQEPQKAAPAAPTPTPTLGRPDRVFEWSREERRDSYANMDKLYATRVISRAGKQPMAAYPLPVELRDLSGVKEGSYMLAEFQERFHVAGMLVVKRGKVVYEHHAHGHTPETLWTSWSMAKSVTSLLVGVALKEGYIRSLDDRLTDYIPALAGGAYDAVTIKNVLQMRSGVAWSEDYANPASDVAGLPRRKPRNTIGLIKYMSERKRDHAPGEHWNYNSGETYMLGAVLRAAIGNNLSSYLSRSLWSRFAMQDDAYWTLDAEFGDEPGGCCLSATMRDYARIGLFVLQRGRLPDGSPVLDEDYLTAATRGGAEDRYGYQWWLNNGSFSARGIHGQELRIYPDDDLVIVVHAFADGPIESFEYAGHVLDAIRDALR